MCSKLNDKSRGIYLKGSAPVSFNLPLIRAEQLTASYSDIDFSKTVKYMGIPSKRIPDPDPDFIELKI